MGGEEGPEGGEDGGGELGVGPPLRLPEALEVGVPRVPPDAGEALGAVEAELLCKQAKSFMVTTVTTMLIIIWRARKGQHTLADVSG